MRGQTSGSGRPLDRLRSLDGLSDRPHGGLQLLGGPSKPGPAKDPRCTNLVSGPSRPDPVSSTSIEAGLLIFGLTTVKDPGWAKAKESFVAPGSMFAEARPSPSWCGPPLGFVWPKLIEGSKPWNLYFSGEGWPAEAN